MKQLNKQTLMLAAFLLIAAAGFFISSKAHADTNLVLPTYLKHIQHADHREYTEDFNNLSVGFEYSIDNYALSAYYVHRNSHDRHSIYGLAFKNYWLSKHNRLLYGGMTAVGGYEESILVMPIIGWQYKYIRVITTYPTAKLAGAPADLLNIQIVIPLRL